MHILIHDTYFPHCQFRYLLVMVDARLITLIFSIQQNSRLFAVNTKGWLRKPDKPGIICRLIIAKWLPLLSLKAKTTALYSTWASFLFQSEYTTRWTRYFNGFYAIYFLTFTISHFQKKYYSSSKGKWNDFTWISNKIPFNLLAHWHILGWIINSVPWYFSLQAMAVRSKMLLIMKTMLC